MDEHKKVMAANLRDIACRLNQFCTGTGTVVLPDDLPSSFDGDMKMLRRIADTLDGKEAE